MKLHPLRLSDKQRVGRYLRSYPMGISEFSFTNLFIWRNVRHHFIAFYKKHLLVSHGEDCFYMPLGPRPVSIMQELLRAGTAAWFHRVPAHVARQMPTGYRVEHDRPDSDYLYDVQELRDMRGNAFVSKRNFIRRFKRYNPEVRMLDADNVEDCLTLHKRWLGKHPPNGESWALGELIRYFSEFPVRGVLLYIKQRPIACAIGEGLTRDTFVEHFEKADRRYTGAYQCVLNEFAKIIPAQYTTLNREQDLGIEGIRKAKESYHPRALLYKYTISLDNAV